MTPYTFVPYGLQQCYYQQSIYKHIMISQEKQEEIMHNPHQELMSLKAQLSALTIAYQQSLQRQEKVIPAFQLTSHKHHAITFDGNKITNQDDGYEVRWTLLGPTVSSEKDTVVRLRVNRLGWMAVGFCHREEVERRSYSRLNSCGDHGTYVMDSSGWFYSHQHPSSNYRPLGFPLEQRDTLSIIYSPKEATVSIINEHRWEKCEVSLRHPPLNNLHPCLAISQNSQVEIISDL